MFLQTPVLQVLTDSLVCDMCHDATVSKHKKQDWINGKARQRSAWESVGHVQKTTTGIVGQVRQIEKKGSDEWVIHIFREHSKEADAWAEKRSWRRNRNMCFFWMVGLCWDGSGRNVEGVWMVSGAAGSRRRDVTDAWDVRNAGGRA